MSDALGIVLIVVFFLFAALFGASLMAGDIEKECLLYEQVTVNSHTYDCKLRKETK